MKNTYKETKKLQDELNERVVDCPKCDKATRWWEITEFGVCFECYAKDQEDSKYSEKEKLY